MGLNPEALARIAKEYDRTLKRRSRGKQEDTRITATVLGVTVERAKPGRLPKERQTSEE